jgi:hypothetical protein
LKEVTKFNQEKFVAERWEYSYNSNQLIISIFKQQNKLDKKVVRTFDGKGNLLEEVNTNAANKELQKIVNDYNASGKIMTLKEYYGGNLVKILSYKYGSQNQLLDIDQTNPDGSKFLNHSYKYDGKGDLVEEKWFDGVPNDYSSRIYKLDNKSNVIEVESYYSDYKYKVLYKYTYEYF